MSRIHDNLKRREPELLPPEELAQRVLECMQETEPEPTALDYVVFGIWVVFAVVAVGSVVLAIFG